MFHHSTCSFTGYTVTGEGFLRGRKYCKGVEPFKCHIDFFQMPFLLLSILDDVS